MNFIFEWQNNILKYCFCHKKIKFISSSRRVMLFLLYRQNDIDEIIEGNYQNYVKINSNHVAILSYGVILKAPGTKSGLSSTCNPTTFSLKRRLSLWDVWPNTVHPFSHLKLLFDHLAWCLLTAAMSIDIDNLKA